MARLPKSVTRIRRSGAGGTCIRCGIICVVVAPSVPELILSVLDDVEPLMAAAFDAVGGSPPPGSSLDQVFLIDGRSVIADYLAHNETALAFDHLLYMITEPPLRLSQGTFDRLSSAGRAMDLPGEMWASARP